jgi:glycosyltransferase involved in cell wall biosynthesis
VSISRSQRTPLPDANWLGTVYHGLPLHLYRFHPRPQDYFAFVGRISPEKRCDRAIEIAIACNTPIRIAANREVEFIGEIGEAEKQDFLGNAKGLIFPIDWPEPFGLVMIEAMACGTPVVAFRHGSVPEVLEDGVTGFIVDNIDEAVAATARCAQLDRRRIRARFEQRFSAERMAQEYRRVYEQVLRRAGARATHSGEVAVASQVAAASATTAYITPDSAAAEAPEAGHA